MDDTNLSATLDNTFDPDSDPATPGTPCETKTLDVKATDHDAPLLVGLLPCRARRRRRGGDSAGP